MMRDERYGDLRRHVARLQRSLRTDLRLVAWGITRAAGAETLWLDCAQEGVRTGTPWRGRARLPRTDTARDRRGLLLALAEALSDVARRSGAGVRLWRREG